MARKQLGTDYVVFVDISETATPNWKVMLCQTTATVNSPKDVIDASSKCGNDSLSELGIETIDFEGQVLQKDATNTSHLSMYEVRQLFRTKEKYNFKLGPKGATSADDGKIIYSGLGEIMSLSETYPNKDVATCTGSITFTGEIDETEFVFTT